MDATDQADFIEVFPGALDATVCREMIDAFNASGKLVRGETGGGLNTRLKDSWDLCISRQPEWAQGASLLNTVMMRGLMAYVRKYPLLALAPVTLNRTDPGSGITQTLDAPAILGLSDTQLQALLVHLFRPGSINLQKYLADQGGYPYWHSEISPRGNDVDPLHRVLLWSIYLNDGFGEGETEFFHQQRKIAPRTGSLLIAPAGFTHGHRGNMPRGGDKYIATSWILFQSAQVLYPQESAPTR